MASTRRLAAILAADVVGYSRLMGADEGDTLARLRAIRAQLLDPKIAEHYGRLVKTTGDGLLIEFGSVVDALRCATEVQAGLLGRNAMAPADKRVEYRIGINMGDIVVEDDYIFGDDVNVAARLEALAEPGGICVSARVQEDAAGKLGLAFEDMGERALKNIARPVRAYRVAMERPAEAAREPPQLPLPDKPSIAVLPFQNMSGDPEQEYFADGMVEEIITALSRIRWLFVIARNSSFTYKGRAVDVKQVGRELGVRYVLEGSVRKGGSRVRISAQLIDALTGTHLWADRFDGSLTSLSFRTKWRRTLPGSSSRHCKPPKPLGPPDARPPISPPTTFICAPMRWSRRRQGKSTTRFGLWRRRLRAIRIMGLHSPGPRSAISGCCTTT